MIRGVLTSQHAPALAGALLTRGGPGQVYQYDSRISAYQEVMTVP